MKFCSCCSATCSGALCPAQAQEPISVSQFFSVFFLGALVSEVPRRANFLRFWRWHDNFFCQIRTGRVKYYTFDKRLDNRSFKLHKFCLKEGKTHVFSSTVPFPRNQVEIESSRSITIFLGGRLMGSNHQTTNSGFSNLLKNIYYDFFYNWKTEKKNWFGSIHMKFSFFINCSIKRTKIRGKIGKIRFVVWCFDPMSSLCIQNF